MGVIRVMLSDKEIEDLLSSLFCLQDFHKKASLIVRPNREEQSELKRIEALQTKLQRLLNLERKND